MTTQERVPPPGHGPAIEAHDLVKTYPKGVRALDGLGFTVPTGTVFGLLGPNGAGKSTTIKILTTLARADSGTARVAGLDVSARPDHVRRVIGVVAQRSGADPVATGRENVLLTGRIQGLRGRDLARRADALLERFGLAGAAGRPVRTYSGGMRRRLDVAMGLVNRPGVLFLDEPTAGLDPQARSQMWEEIGRLAGDEGITILLTTHYLEEADRLARRLAIIDRGRVVAEGAPDDLKGGLRGDAVHVELAWPPGGAGQDRVNRDGRAGWPVPPGGPDAVLAALDRVPAIRECRMDGSHVSARADDGASALPAVLAALDGAGIGVRAATVARPSLDDVYLRHTGRRYTDDAGPGGPAAAQPPVPATATSGGTR